MTIVVVGAGAIGLLVAGQLARSSQRIVLLARPATAAAIRQQGVRILHHGRLHAVRDLAVITDPAALDPQDHEPDLAILCVKGYDTVGAMPSLDALGPRTILTLQNGIGNEELLAERFGAGRIVSGAITSSVEVEMPGRVAVARNGGIGLAPLVPRTEVGCWAAMLRAAGFRVREYADYRALKWSKAVLNMLGNATAAILDMPVEAVYADRRLVALEWQMVREALLVMDRLGIQAVNLPHYPVALLARAMRWAPAAALGPLLRRAVAGGRGGKPPSLHLDLARGSRRSEGEFLYGAVASAAEQAGVAAPVNRKLWAILHAIATGEIPWSTYRHQPDRLLAALAATSDRP
jgi:2-dehydropantoate 2-reductase